MKKHLAVAAAVALFSAAAPVFAARAWLLPSQTIVARSGGWVSFDAANADDLFSFNQSALALDGLTVSTPDGQPVQPQNAAKGRTRSSFDLELRVPGTYRVAVVADTVMARWEEDGKPKRWRGAPADVAANLPADAPKLDVELTQRRVETFVTVGAPTPAVKPAGVGLELIPATHPNDLYAGEPARFQLLLDGKPAADVAVEIIAGGTRYRDSPEPINLRSDAGGHLTVTWPAAGLYWFDAELQDEKSAVPRVKKRRAAYNAVFEVLTQ